jgi:hypothetical protein
MEDVLKFRVGDCGSCEFRTCFWPVDGARVERPGCGAEHEVKIDTAVNLGTGSTKEAAWMILVSDGCRIKHLVE